MINLYAMEAWTLTSLQITAIVLTGILIGTLFILFGHFGESRQF